MRIYEVKEFKQKGYQKKAVEKIRDYEKRH